MLIERLPTARPSPPPRITGIAIGASTSYEFEVVGARRLSLDITFLNDLSPPEGEVFSEVTLQVQGKLEIIELGRCRLEALEIVRDEPPSSVLPLSVRGSSAVMPASSAAPAHEGRWGKLVPLDAPIHCGELFRSGQRKLIVEAFDQLPLLFARKELVSPEFQRFTADLVYDFRIYRAIFDDIDAGLASESAATRVEVERSIIEGPGRRFMRFFDERIADLEAIVRPFSRQEHERHGFYFRRQLWDVILTSPFLARTNIRPRGYAGDWVMMQYLYRNEYLGSSLFGKLLHKNSMETAAALAVRNRRQLIVDALRAERERGTSNGAPLRFLSVACGPACEVEDLFKSGADCDAYACALLDQDEEALRQAARGVRAIEQRTRRSVRARFIRQSVRTMLRTPHFAEVFGLHHVVYSMGLFDYLTAPVAKAVLQKLYDLLKPGGQMIIGNYHVANPTRWYMEYWADWTLIYRTEEDLLALAADLPGATCSVSFEVTGSQMFLWVRKAAR